MSGSARSSFRLPRIPAVPLAVLVGVVLGALLVLVSGGDPVAAYREILIGALAPANWPNTLNWAVPLVGMTLVAAIPLRGGMVNLGGDGQLVVGGLVAALVPLYLPGPGPLLTIVAIIAAMIAAGLYASIAAWGETRFGIPMLISSLLLSYPAIGVASYIVGFPLRDTTTGLAQTVMIPDAARLPTISGPLNVGLILMMIVAIAVVFYDRRTVGGYELRMRGLNAKFAGYGGVSLGPQTVRIMFASGAIAGLVGAIIVLGSQYRFQDGALLSPGYTWSGLMAALLAGGEPLGATGAGLFFAALQTGGFAMQRETAIPRVLTMVLQAIIILFLAIRHGVGRRAS
ncbi:ABC transporter permease [Kaistia dalseonensis]|uniref:Simple sugar transport system permease protein n=1 Tax=Kaistia dalseonensis TaxID=410840 RepID=A0ABU0HAF3_9HYPH|nr:ABC transporter permease [Kaistia dalseonensis]MCX5496673.1 ABC transporter permease [Kaistia dalseonensis]MDQ0439297.1 simple sugar transport system permease protein [Kaistia dalseonensis]